MFSTTCTFCSLPSRSSRLIIGSPTRSANQRRMPVFFPPSKSLSCRRRCALSNSFRETEKGKSLTRLKVGYLFNKSKTVGSYHSIKACDGSSTFGMSFLPPISLQQFFWLFRLLWRTLRWPCRHHRLSHRRKPSPRLCGHWQIYRPSAFTWYKRRGSVGGGARRSPILRDRKSVV